MRNFQTDDLETQALVDALKARLAKDIVRRSGVQVKKLLWGKDYSSMFKFLGNSKKKSVISRVAKEVKEKDKPNLIAKRYAATADQYMFGWSENQKAQFKDNYQKLIEKMGWDDTPSRLVREIRKVEAKIEKIANRHFSGKKLNPNQEQFVKDYGEFFINPKNGEGRAEAGFNPHGQGGKTCNSSWILAFKYNGDTNRGHLLVRMIRGKAIYDFPYFPFDEYVLLCKVTVHVGKYWWDEYLWKYGTGRYSTGFSNSKVGGVQDKKPHGRVNTEWGWGKQGPKVGGEKRKHPYPSNKNRKKKKG